MFIALIPLIGAIWLFVHLTPGLYHGNYKKWRVKHINESSQNVLELVLVDRGKSRKQPLFIASTVMWHFKTTTEYYIKFLKKH